MVNANVWYRLMNLEDRQFCSLLISCGNSTVRQPTSIYTRIIGFWPVLFDSKCFELISHLSLRQDGLYDLDVKKGAQASKIKPVTPSDISKQDASAITEVQAHCNFKWFLEVWPTFLVCFICLWRSIWKHLNHVLPSFFWELVSHFCKETA